MRRRAFAGGVFVFLALAGCGVVLGLDPPTYDGPPRTVEAGATDGSVAEAAAPILPGKLDDPARWSRYVGNGPNYRIGTFDGRFVYFVRGADVDGPDAGLTGSRILRYDTRSAAFDDPKAWTTFDPEDALETTGPHATAVMEGKYLVIGAFADRVFLRYDTTQPETLFSSSTGWERFDAAALGETTAGYNAAIPISGGVIFNNGASLTPLIHKGEPFNAGWEKAEQDGGVIPCASTYNAVCAGSRVFFVPGGSDSVACLSSYDTTKTLSEGFENFDVATLGEEFAYMAGGVATPSHLYVTQYFTKDAEAPVKFLRRPLNGLLDAGWETQPTNTKNPLTRGFVGGTFDGRFIYFAPYPTPTTTVIFARFDTTLGFNDPNAWEMAAGAAVGVPANRYWGAIFDGQYVYYSSYTPLGNEPAAFARYKAFDTPIAVPPVCR